MLSSSYELEDKLRDFHEDRQQAENRQFLKRAEGGPPRALTVGKARASERRKLGAGQSAGQDLAENDGDAGDGNMEVAILAWQGYSAARKDTGSNPTGRDSDRVAGENVRRELAMAAQWLDRSLMFACDLVAVALASVGILDRAHAAVQITDYPTTFLNPLRPTGKFDEPSLEGFNFWISSIGGAGDFRKNDQYLQATECIKPS